jgi:hypothetical protein
LCFLEDGEFREKTEKTCRCDGSDVLFRHEWFFDYFSHGFSATPSSRQTATAMNLPYCAAEFYGRIFPSGERRLAACPSRQLAETLARRDNAGKLRASLSVAGKLPATAGWQPALPRERNDALQVSVRSYFAQLHFADIEL